MARNGIGTFTYPGHTPGAAPITVTGWLDGARATTARNEPRPDGEVVVVGDVVLRE